MTSQLDTEQLSQAYLNALNVIGNLVHVLADDYIFEVDLSFIKKLRSHITNSNFNPIV